VNSRVDEICISYDVRPASNQDTHCIRDPSAVLAKEVITDLVHAGFAELCRVKHNRVALDGLVPVKAGFIMYWMMIVLPSLSMLCHFVDDCSVMRQFIHTLI
jgi:hypothetical protein